MRGCRGRGWRWHEVARVVLLWKPLNASLDLLFGMSKGNRWVSRRVSGRAGVKKLGLSGELTR